MTQHPTGIPSLFDDGKIGSGTKTNDQSQSKLQTTN